MTTPLASGPTGSTGQVPRWDGTNWWSLGAEFNAAVNALAIQNGSLCAGGAFTTSYTGGITEKRIARWNGSAWAIR